MDDYTIPSDIRERKRLYRKSKAYTIPMLLDKKSKAFLQIYPITSKYDHTGTTNGEKAKLLNDFFVKQTHLKIWNKSVPILGPSVSESNLSEIRLLQNKVEHVLKSRQMDKASELYEISNKILREASHELSFPLCDILIYSNYLLRGRKQT